MFNILNTFRKNDTHTIIEDLEIIFAEIVTTSTSSRTWDENHISFTLMEKLQKFFDHKRVVISDWHKIVDWQSFKNRGKQETEYGDIAILVNIQFSDGGLLKGVACIEAKRSFRSGNFDSINQFQIDRIYGNMPHSQLLLYTHYNPRIPLKFPNTKDWNSNMWTTSMNTAKELLPQISTNNQRILRTSFPFSMFLMSRIFWGHDLDYRKKIYDSIQNGIVHEEIFNPTFLAVANVYYEGQRPIEIDLSDKWVKIY